jgi:hypothetical protein
MAVNPIKVWNGTAWEYTGPVVAAPPVKYQATAPTSPATGDVWVESDYDVASVDPSKLLTGGVYTNESTRSAAIPTPTTGMVTYVGDTGTDSSTIPQLETYTGSAWQTPYGLSLVAKVDFTSAASIAIDNVFTTAYDNYKIIFNLSAFSGATETDLLMYLRAGGTDTTTNYVTERLYQESTTIGANRVTTGRIGYMSTTYPTFTNCDITMYGPKQSRKTVWTSHGFYIQNNGTPNQALTSGYQDTTTSFDGIKIYPNTGTSISGTFRIYGLRNS